ncbi:MAG: hypothetical protein ACW99F_16790, partial [Candidatus Hodarchaeales archaeon]
MPNNNKIAKKLPIRVDLDNDDALKFKAVWEKFELKNKSDVLRFCVNKVYHGITLDIDEDLRNEIHKIISNRQIRLRYAITSVDDFIKRAISEFLVTLREEWSLKNWNIRQTLTEEENDTALAL